MNHVRPHLAQRSLTTGQRGEIRT